MTKAHKLFQLIISNFQGLLRTWHGRFLIIAIAISVIYMPAWLFTLFKSKTSFVSLCFLALGVSSLWKKREQLDKFNVTLEEKIIGYSFIVIDAFFFFAFYDSLSLRYVNLVIILAGSAISSWGILFFRENVIAPIFIAVSLYPRLLFLFKKLWLSILDPYLLENFMAWVAGHALQLLGKPAIIQERFISLPNGAIEVGPSCSGYAMAVTMACIGLMLGIFFKQGIYKTCLIVFLGVILALITNVPRIILLAYVVGYFDEAVFDFWHGPWGGQIFSALLFTPYYYIVMAIIHSKLKLLNL